ncbi:MAG TPA: FAD-binding oxidoreductase [Terriglobales bacterium]|nr:FAD-binding oxidoreductase [Terriglobales bacterium]
MSHAVAEVAGALRSRFAGEILCPEDSEFAAAHTIWNGMVQRTPGLILRCANVADVQAAVRACSVAGVLTAIRCGGHSLAGFSSCDGGVVLDLSRMRDVTVDPSRRTARAAGGCLLGSIDTATQAAGLAFPAGVVSHTGASGLILGGGTGWLTRLCGLSCDNVEAFTLVTADGALLRADSGENSDLYWALRGGGGNFGVVTEFELRLHPIRCVLLASAWSKGADALRVLRFWREFMPAVPDALKWNVSLMLAPDTAQVPAELRGRVAVSHGVAWFGGEDEGRLWLKKILAAVAPSAACTETKSFLALQTMADSEFPHGARYYTKSGYFLQLDDSTIERMVESLATVPSARSQIELAYLGGAAARVDAAETAFGDRGAPFITNLLAHWNDAHHDEVNVAWVRRLFATLRPRMKPGVYVNFMSGDEAERVPEAYSARWERLLAIKQKYDPRNFFRLNQNIRAANTARSVS